MGAVCLQPRAPLSEQSLLTAYTLLGVVALCIGEYVVHRRRLQQLPIRVHVNGTRGKSSVARLIAAGLRQGGIRCFAKTTGTVPRYILPNGREVPVYRPSRPNIIEQRRAVHMAVAQRSEALVIECMALQPKLQWLSESKLIKATHGVITNARPDHLDVMGPREEDVALAMAATVPTHGTLFTTERKHRNIFRMAAKDRGADVVEVEPSAADYDTSTLGPFAYREHPDNVALALKVCESLGVPREVALRGMWSAKPDPGAMTEHSMDFFGRHFVFVNGFAANDPISTEQIWEQALLRHPDVGSKIALFNCREDRTDRSKQLAEAYSDWSQADEVVLMGSGQYFFARNAIAKGLDPSKLTFVDTDQPAEMFESLASLVPSSALIMGMGNIAGPGLGLCEFIANRRIPDA